MGRGIANTNKAVVSLPQSSLRVTAERDLAFTGFMPIDRSPIRAFFASDTSGPEDMITAIQASPRGLHPNAADTWRETALHQINASGEYFAIETISAGGKEYERCLYRGNDEAAAVAACNSAFYYVIDNNYEIVGSHKDFLFSESLRAA